MQGFNMGRYHPPESLDKALAEKASSGFNRTKDGKSTQAVGVPTIRFEMPFAIWCTSCKPEMIIGQGVRFNAQKTKVGNYYSTPIWNFRMKHGHCGGSIDIRTDPQAGDYVVHQGARKRDYGDAGNDVQQTLVGEVMTEADKAKQAADPFASLEGRIDQKEKARKDGWWVEKIQEHKDRDWNDTFAANRRLRQAFRVERKGLEAKDKERQELSDRLGLHIEVLDEVPEDRKRAALMQFGRLEVSTDQSVVTKSTRPLFRNDESAQDQSKRLRNKNQTQADKNKAQLQNNLKANTRALSDPFLSNVRTASTKRTLLTGMKRKRAVEEQSQESAGEQIAAKQASLVSYESSDGD